ncbi:hypothetical protein SCATT_37840 [Streptantibioticus cattleyicolor NRRL 8057 = DSM 46488]|uniref:Uncharacterized protein n=1 Tax=Streptantibioticus cattleyicolor (strain ATCC 35852 / DSM 46488 / JCM 4925 / NBRC 14057 / NRRL 8057) TaxID=1003195 RepID=G8X322_STREN|nr:hypothetical protein SCATT_37840 [Streptantibioticus cattleyicolor NRRL 8057 = DSM 46488]
MESSAGWSGRVVRPHRVPEVAEGVACPWPPHSYVPVTAG